MADLKNKKHLFFDLDDTLWDFRRNSSDALCALYADFGLSVKLGVEFETFFEAYRKLNLRYWRDYSLRRISKEQLRTKRFHEAFLQFGYDNYDENLQFSSRYIETAPHGRHLKQHCIETLEWLRDRYSLHVITNGFTEIANLKLDKCGLRPYFSVILISEEHGMFKPDTGIFRLAERLADATADECVMIGDTLESDIAGGIGAGWSTILVSSETPADHSGLVISSLDELRNYF